MARGARTMGTGAASLWMLCLLAAAAAQDPSQLYGGGLQFLPAPGAAPLPAPGQEQAALQGLPVLQYSAQPAPGGYLLGPSGGGYAGDPAPEQGPRPRTGPLTFGPEHARPATTTPNPFRQGPLVQAAVQQQRLLQQLQQQQLAYATPSSPSGRYASLPPAPEPAPGSDPASAPAGPTGFANYGGFASLGPSAPGLAAPGLAAPGFGLALGPEQQGAPSPYTYSRR